MDAGTTARKVLGQPAICWLAAAAALSWHVPSCFGWHAIADVAFVRARVLLRDRPSFLVAVFSVASVPSGPMVDPFDLFLATLPCDVLPECSYFRPGRIPDVPLYAAAAGLSCSKTSSGRCVDVDLRHGCLLVAGPSCLFSCSRCGLHRSTAYEPSQVVEVALLSTAADPAED